MRPFLVSFVKYVAAFTVATVLLMLGIGIGCGIYLALDAMGDAWGAGWAVAVVFAIFIVLGSAVAAWAETPREHD